MKTWDASVCPNKQIKTYFYWNLIEACLKLHHNHIIFSKNIIFLNFENIYIYMIYFLHEKCANNIQKKKLYILKNVKAIYDMTQARFRLVYAEPVWNEAKTTVYMRDVCTLQFHFKSFTPLHTELIFYHFNYKRYMHLMYVRKSSVLNWMKKTFEEGRLLANKEQLVQLKENSTSIPCQRYLNFS